MSKTYRIGIVGVGAIADMHALAVGDLENAELVGGSCRTEEKGKKFAEKYACSWHSSYDELYRQEKPDLVTICTPSGAHMEPTVAAAKLGIHVLCEKPIEINLDRARQMIAAAEEHKIKLGGIFPQRFNPVVRTVYDAARSGRFGSFACSIAYVPWWRDDAYYSPDRWQGTQALDGGGAMINQSIHAIDAMQWIASAAGAGETESVFAFTGQCGHEKDLIEVEDNAVAVVRFSSGPLGSILASTAMWPGTALRIHVAGRNGTAEVHENQMVTWRFRDETPEDDQIRKKYGQPASVGGAADPMAIDYSNHTRNIADFLAALDGDKPLDVDADEACKALAIIRGAYDSAATGKMVTL